MTAQSTFAYKARESSGSIVMGVVSGASADEVAARLRAEGKFVVNVQANAGTASEQLDVEQIRRNEAARRVKRDDVIAFCQQLSVMLSTGVPLTEALDSFCVQSKSKEFRAVLRVLSDDICGGEKFSEAMSKWPRVFPSMIVSLMRASEASGKMALMLGRVGDYLSKEQRTARQIKGALSYPIFMMVTAVALTIGLMAFVLPKFAKVYEMRASTLPRPTKFLLGMSDFVTQQYWYYGPAVVVLAVLVAVFMHRPSGRKVCDWLRLHIPIVGNMYAQLYTTRAARTMSTLLGSGVNLLDVIAICRGVTNNAFYDRLWDQMERDVRDGKQMSEAIFASGYISRNIASMVASGERSGQLPEVMERIASFTEEQLDLSVKKVTSFIEPVMILFMGVVVGGVAMALLLPIFKMGKVMGG